MKTIELVAHVQVVRWRWSPGNADFVATLYNNAETLHQNANERVSAVVVSMKVVW